MADNASKWKFDNLSHENYTTWSFRMEMLLKREGVWNDLLAVVNEEAPENAGEAEVESHALRYQQWRDNQQRALEEITFRCDTSQIIHIKRCNTGGEAWNNLRQHHVRPTLSGKVNILTQLCCERIKPGGNMREHLDKLWEMFDRLTEMDFEIPPNIAAGIIIASVRHEYRLIISTMDGWQPEVFTPINIKKKLMEEWDRTRHDRARIRSEIHVIKEQNHMERENGLAMNRNYGDRRAGKYNGGERAEKYNGGERAGTNSGGGRSGKYNGNAGTSYSSDAGTGQSGSGTVNRDGRLTGTKQNNSQGSHEVFRCHNCRQPGHSRSNCPYKSGLKASENKINDWSDESYSTAFYSSCFSANNWIIDSGASTHMCKDPNEFDFMNEKYQAQICVGDGRLINAVGIGNVTIRYDNDGQTGMLELHDVLYVPDLADNLLSVRKLTEKNDVVKFTHTKVYCGNEINDMKSIGKLHRGLYKMKKEGESCNTAVQDENALCIHQWHTKLAHRNLDNIRRLAKQGTIKLKKCTHSDVCEECLAGKMARKAFPSHATPVENSMDVVVSDVCGEFQVESLGRKKYFITFTDVYSKHCEVYFIRKKSEAADATIRYINKMETQLGKRPKVFRSDRGKEYLNKKLQDFLEKKGIQPQCTVGYAPEQNGIAERKNRTLVEAARCMLEEAKLPKTLWAEAINTANYVVNRIAVGKTGQMTSPYEKLFNKQPNLLKLHSFGEETRVMIPYEKRRKLDAKSVKMRFIGYDSMAKGYRLLDKNFKIHVSREVHFLGEGELFSNHKGKRKEKPGKAKTGNTKNSEKNNTRNKENDSDDGYIDRPLLPRLSEPQQVEEENDEEFLDAEEEISTESEDEAMELRRSTRVNFGQPPVRLNDYVLYKAGEKRTQTEPRNYKEALNSTNAQQWKQAMEKELEAIEENETWELTNLPKGRRAVGSKWVFKEKRDSFGRIIKFKARLVAQGFSQKYGIDYDEVFAPVARQTSFRLLLSMAGTRNYKVLQYDIKSAFLNGKLEEEIFMKPPPGYRDTEKVYRLKKSLYGLKQSARVWNQTLHEALVKEGCVQNCVDNCLYSRKNGGNTSYIIIHVDDILIAGNNENDIKRMMKNVGKSFEITNLGGVKHYLGIDIERDRSGRFMISQPSYIDSIVEVAGLNNAKTSKFPMDTGYYKQLGTPIANNDEYRKLIGMLLYLTINTRPDIAACVATLSRKVENPRDNDLNEVKRVIKYLKGTRNLKLILNQPQGSDDIIVYSDANWAEDIEDRKSNTGYYVSLNGGTISWSCRKQDIVAMSSAESEYIALAETCKEVLWIKEIMKALDINAPKTTTIFTDSQSCIAMLKNQRFSHRTKHFDTRFHFIRDHVNKGTIRLEYVPTSENTADLMTKPLGGPKTEYLRQKAGLFDCVTRGGVLEYSYRSSHSYNLEPF